MFNFLSSPSLSCCPGSTPINELQCLSDNFLWPRRRVTDHNKPVSLCSTLPLPQPLLYAKAVIQLDHSRHQENNTLDQGREALVLKNAGLCSLISGKVFRMCVGMNWKDPHQNGRNRTLDWTELINMDEFTKDACFCVFADMGKNCLYNWSMYMCSVLTLTRWDKILEICCLVLMKELELGGYRKPGTD